MAAEEIENEIKILNQRVVDLSERGLYQEALASAKRSYDLAKRHINEDSPTFITSVNNLAAVHHCLRNYIEAKEFYQLSLEIERRTGEDDPDVATILHNLAVLERELDEYVSAEGHLQEALKAAARYTSSSCSISSSSSPCDEAEHGYSRDHELTAQSSSWTYCLRVQDRNRASTKGLIQ
jgi:tetratricopeptide (TPR) repeat protein